MRQNEATIQADISAIQAIDVIPTILEVICKTTGMGFAAVARVTETRWIACSVRDGIHFGLLPGGELPLQTTICDEIRQSGKGVIIDHVSEDPHFRLHHTPVTYGFQSYISLPIFKRNGQFFGTLCAIDPRPAKLNNPETISMFKLYAELIAFHLDVLDQRKKTEVRLQEHEQAAELREQFIAVLGHDLRNPVSAIRIAAEYLTREEDSAANLQMFRIILSASHRVAGMIDNIMDFARGRLGDGINLTIIPVSLTGILQEVIGELQVIWKDRIILEEYDLQQPVCCDTLRIAQLLSNLVGNALHHGDPSKPVLVQASSDESRFVLKVTNEGEAIPESAMSLLFHPFVRGHIKPGQDGLGLGLYIVSEIARAHGGAMEVISGPHTTFTFSMPSGSDLIGHTS